MVEVIILDVDGEEILKRDEKDFIRAEFVKRDRAGSGIINALHLELTIESPKVLEPISEMSNLTAKLVDSESGYEAGIENGGMDEYKVKSSNAEKLTETLSIAGTKI